MEKSIFKKICQVYLFSRRIEDYIWKSNFQKSYRLFLNIFLENKFVVPWLSMWSRERKLVSGPAFLPRSQILGWKWFRGEGGDCRFCWFGQRWHSTSLLLWKMPGAQKAFSNICQVYMNEGAQGWGHSWVWIPDLLFTSWVILANLIMILSFHTYKMEIIIPTRQAFCEDSK